MPDLLLELRSEEIPARMQRKAAGDLKKMLTDGLVEAGLTYEAAREYWTPRRLTLDIRGLTARSKDIREEIKGPSTTAPEQAVQGFLRKAGLVFDRRGACPFRPEEGRLLRRPYLEAGQGGRRDHRRPGAGHHPRLPLAEIDALGSGFGKARLAALGAAAAVDPLHLRPGDRGAGGGRFRDRRHPLRQHHLRPPLSCAGRDHRAPLRRLCEPSSRRQRSCSMPTAARRSSLPTPATLPSPTGSIWSRTRGCWRRSPAWSNGRWC